MKYYILLTGLFFLSFLSYSQSVGINYFSTGTGRNITANYGFTKNNNEFGLGLGYNINSIKQPDDQSNIYYRRLFATRPIQHLNFNLFYHKYFLTKLNHIQPFAFYDFQMKYSTTRSSMYIPYAFDSTIVANTPDEKVLYREYIEYFGPFLWVENAIGIGFKVNIYKKWYLQQMAGLGIHIILGYDNRLARNEDNWCDWEFGGLFNLGIVYRILDTKGL